MWPAWQAGLLSELGRGIWQARVRLVRETPWGIYGPLRFRDDPDRDGVPQPMTQRFLRLCLLLPAALAALLSGCSISGLSQNPNYFPYLCLDGDIIRTHAKPPGKGYYA